MFRTQIEQLKETELKIEASIEINEDNLRKQKAELRDVKQALTSLERIQSKYEVKDETSNIHI